MQHSLFGITEKNAHRIAYEVYSSCGTNENKLNQMKHVLYVALNSELTSRQRECLELYYYKDMKMCEIASFLSVAPSTVTRHIKAAERKLKNLAKYC